jgi:hypothetical protein
MHGALVGYVKADTRSGVLIYRRRFPLELVPFIPLADGAGLMSRARPAWRFGTHA